MSTGLIIVAILAYSGALVALAVWADRRPRRLSGRSAPLIYALSLGVYATSWTFFGAVGTGAQAGWDYLPIYLGPILMFTIGAPVLARLVRVGKAQHATSLADFISARYGKSRAVAALVTLVALAGSLPYIALQLRSIAMGISAMTGATPSPGGGEAGLLIALSLAGFAILFGTRAHDMTTANHGLVAVVAGESIVKFLALAAVAVLAVWALSRDGISAPDIADPFQTFGLDDRFLTLTFLSMAAVLCLPRQFHMMVVECQDAGHVRTARWLFPPYLLGISVMVVPIVYAGQALTPDAVPDLFVLSIPLAMDAQAVALLVFLGGFSAATAMIIVASLALSHMIASEIVSPLLLRHAHGDDAKPLARRLLHARRFAILGIVLLAYGYQRGVQQAETLASLGVLAFAAAVQFLPALLGGLFWRRGHRQGVLWGLGAGFALWAGLIMLPAYAGDSAFLGRLIPWADPLTSGVILSLGINAFLYWILSVRASHSVSDRLQAGAFVAPQLQPDKQDTRSGLTVGDVRVLMTRSLGQEPATEAFNAFFLVAGRRFADHERAGPGLIDFAESQLARSIGASSARVVMGSVQNGGRLPVEDVVTILDETSQILNDKQALLTATLEHLSQGVSVVDKELRLVAWNSAYVRLFHLPDDLVYVGRPIADIIRYNAAQGALGPGDVEAQVTRRLEHLRAGAPHSYERAQADGRVIRLQGNPMPGGGYVTSFTDISEDKAKEQALEEARDTLEDRVKERTEELEAARHLAERATQSKTRFLAAASHDLLQPLNAARLFASALTEELADHEPPLQQLVDNIEQSIGSADQLLKALLDISKLDAGGLSPSISTFPLRDLLEDLAREASVLAADKGLKLTNIPCSLWVQSDRGLLMSVLQNFLANGVRYTASGRILLGCRRRGQMVDIQVADTGPGIPEGKQQAVFEEFVRLNAKSEDGGTRGMGLGLAISQRIATLLDHPLAMRSIPGRGSVFSIQVPIAAPATVSPLKPRPMRPGQLAGHRILCLDDDGQVLAAYDALLRRWGAEPLLAHNEAEAQAMGGPVPDLALLDYQLGHGVTGLAVFDRLCAAWGQRPPAILITAERSETVRADALAHQLYTLPKPVNPAALRALINSLTATAAE